MDAERTARRLRNRILSALLPGYCLLCAGRCADVLCSGCRDDLPLLSGHRCPVCASATAEAGVCPACRRQAPHFDATACPCAYAFPADRLIQTLKYGHQLAIARLLAELMLAAPRPTGDLVIPVPLADTRLRERGFNQAVEIARPLARALQLPLATSLCRRQVDTLAQARLPWHVRRRNVRAAFACIEDLTGKSVVVVDDVMTTGATLDELAATLKRAGAVRVCNWVAARTPQPGQTARP